MRRSHVSLLAVLLSLFAIVSACDSGGPGSSVKNEFSFTIQPTSSGSSSLEASQEQVSGFSFFYDATNPNTGEDAFGIYMSDVKSFSKQKVTQGLFGFIARNSNRPGTGTYSFGDPQSGIGSSEFVGLLYKDFTNVQSAPYYVIEGGTLTLNESSDQKVSGTIEATGTKFTFSGTAVDTQSVKITGQFTAEDIDSFVPFSTPGV